MNTTTRMKKMIAAGVLGATALGAASVAPSIALAHDGDRAEYANLTEEERQALREERQAEREARRAEQLAPLLEVLGMDADALQSAREAGQSLADIAAAQGVAIEDVVAVLVDSRTAHIQEHVTAGDITQEEADERIASLEERITERVNSTPGERGDGDGEGRRGRGRGGMRGATGEA